MCAFILVTIKTIICRVQRVVKTIGGGHERLYFNSTFQCFRLFIFIGKHDVQICIDTRVLLTNSKPG